jgi:hypothetical protein
MQGRKKRQATIFMERGERSSANPEARSRPADLPRRPVGLLHGGAQRPVAKPRAPSRPAAFRTPRSAALAWAAAGLRRAEGVCGPGVCGPPCRNGAEFWRKNASRPFR